MESAVSKLQFIIELLGKFDGVTGKLEPIIRQIDLAGTLIDRDSREYEKLAKAREILQETVDKKYDEIKAVKKVVKAMDYIDAAMQIRLGQK